MRSLRSRLVASVLGIAAVGLLLLGGITYAEQRSFLLDRLDRQARSSTTAAVAALANDGFGAIPPRDGDDRGGHGPGGPRPTDLDLPTGTYAQLRDASGKVLGSHTFRYDSATVVRPDIPAKLTPGTIVTVEGKSGDGARYRVLEVANGGGFVVVAIPMREVDQTLHRLLTVEALVFAAVLLALGIAAMIVVRIGLLPLDRIGHTAGAIAGGDLSHRVENDDPRTEVGRLGISLNAMLDRLERAFAERQESEARLRRFLADASHELRTPLASIRGYAELYRIGAASSDADVARSMQRIEDEAARMGVLVEDLLTLARLDEVADAPDVEVDVTALARDVVDDARATAPDREISLSGDAAALVTGRPDQLHQVLANLLRNALVHTPAGTQVEVTVGKDERVVRIEVRDHGPGLPDGDPEALFDRFWRAEGGRERGKDGAGLGLAIVAAIVDAHGGTVAAGNAGGGGAVFSVQLPARGA